MGKPQSNFQHRTIFGVPLIAGNLEIESMLIHPRTWGIETIKQKQMKNMNTTLEIPEGSKATIQGKVIDGKNYLVVEVEQESELKEGDMCIFWNSGPSLAYISVYKHFLDGIYVDVTDFYWANAIKWDGTK